jgi:hypothetical protein
MFIYLDRASIATRGQGSGTHADPFLGGVKIKLVNVWCCG